MDQAITAHAYPPTVWSAGEVVEDQVQICAANVEAGRYAVRKGLYSRARQVRVADEAGAGVVFEDRARLLEFRLGLVYGQHCWCASARAGSNRANEAGRGVSTPAAGTECGLVFLRCRNRTCGGAWAGVVQPLGERTQCYGLPMTD